MSISTFLKFPSLLNVRVDPVLVFWTLIGSLPLGIWSNQVDQ